MILFEKKYYGESLPDLGRDVDEALQVDYNPLMTQVPVDKYGFLNGKFTVTIQWENNE